MTRRPVDSPPQANSGGRSIAANRTAGLGAAALLAVALVIVPAAPFLDAIPVARAACPRVEVVFALGRQEPPVVGFVCDAFLNSLPSTAHIPSVASPLI